MKQAQKKLGKDNVRSHSFQGTVTTKIEFTHKYEHQDWKIIPKTTPSVVS